MAAKDDLVAGVIVGSRKAGTTWMYENFRNDPAVNVSSVVKESRFFLGQIDTTAYHALFAESLGIPRVEVDTALAASVDAPMRMNNYNPDISSAMILREPAEFAVSRFIHGRRKGEFAEGDLEGALNASPEFQNELEYEVNVNRFIEAGVSLKVFQFEDLKRNPERFYRSVRAHVCGVDLGAHVPQLSGVVNPARESAGAAWVPKLLAKSASRARSLGLHRVVNAAKTAKVHERFERPSGEDIQLELRETARALIARDYPSTHEYWSTLHES